MDSPQSIVPARRDAAQMLSAITRPERLNINDGQQYTGTDATVKVLEECRCSARKRVIQNSGTTAVRIGLGINDVKGSFHFVLSACTAKDDGKGASIDLSWWSGEVSVYFPAGTAGYVNVIEALDGSKP